MKLLVLSDSHGCVETMISAARREKPQAIVHLGDYWRDGQKLHSLLPEIPLYQVAGNCDCGDYDPNQATGMVRLFDGVPCYLTHGHKHMVKMSLLRLLLATRQAGAKVALFGHTHRSLCMEQDGILFVNPGSCGSFSGTYAVLTVEHGAASGEIRQLRQP